MTNDILAKIGVAKQSHIDVGDGIEKNSKRWKLAIFFFKFIEHYELHLKWKSCRQMYYDHWTVQIMVWQITRQNDKWLRVNRPIDNEKYLRHRGTQINQWDTDLKGTSEESRIFFFINFETLTRRNNKIIVNFLWL